MCRGGGATSCKHRLVMLQHKILSKMLCLIRPLGVYQPRMVDIMFECSSSELLTGAVSKYHADHGHDASMQYATIKMLVLIRTPAN